MSAIDAEPVVVITGASGGIGAALAAELRRRHATVVLVARRAEALARVAEGCGAGAVALVADMTLRDEVQRVVEDALARCGRIDVWVNNVGQGITRNPSELTDEDLDAMMRVNVKSALYGMQAIVPYFQARGTGHVITVSSTLGRIPHRVFRVAYNGAKHFLNALVANYRDEVAATHPDIVFSLVSPGAVRTAFGANARHGGPLSTELADAQSPEEVAGVIADLVESRRRDVYTRRGTRDRVVEYYSGLGEDP